MDVAKYRARYEAELKKAAPPKTRARSGRRSLAAGVAGAQEAVASAAEAALLEDSDESLAQQVAQLLATLRDRDQALDVRMAALQALAALDFLGAHFAPYRAAYKEALREVATDPERALRESALELLAIEKDDYAQQLLLKGLKEPKEAMVSDAKAIQFLGYDDHADIVPLAREVFERGKGVAREEALKVLATDPESEKLLAKLLADKSEKPSIRRLSASGLQSLNPDAFEKSARKIVADDSDDDAIRATSIAALAHGRESADKPVDPKLVEAVQQLGQKTRSRAMRSSIRRFLQATEG